ncbi:MAG: hypothetical protein JJT99_04845 [Rhodobacteraceae bacterium]|nr:hypothetical protein [Paracoccaceae bacterium]
MIPRAAPFLSVLLALTLVFAALGHGYAQARAPVSELHELVICGETGLETILIDANGQPVDPEDCAQALCNDCLRVVAALCGPLPVAMPQALTARLASTSFLPLLLCAAPPRANLPRAPPSSIKLG